jgi:hypothetical protein
MYVHVYGSTINPAFNGSERFRVTLKLQKKQYELQILKTTEEDLGLYVCEARRRPLVYKVCAHSYIIFWLYVYMV